MQTKHVIVHFSFGLIVDSLLVCLCIAELRVKFNSVDAGLYLSVLKQNAPTPPFFFLQEYSPPSNLPTQVAFQLGMAWLSERYEMVFLV